MGSKFHKLFTGAAVLTIGITSCIVAPAANAGEIPLNGVFSWGENSTGSLGTGSASVTKTPALAADKIPNVVKAATSSTHSLFLDNEGNLYASGDNSGGQLGNGTTTSSSSPVKVILPLRYGVPDYATQIWVGNNVSFMRGSYGDLYSWGSNEKGLTGLGQTTGNTLTPERVKGVKLESDNKEKFDVSSTHAGLVASAAWDSEHGWEDTDQLFLWGENPGGILGRPSNTGSVVPSPSRTLIPDPEENTLKSVDICNIVTDEETGDSHEDCNSIEIPKTYDELIGFSPQSVAVGKNFSVAHDGNNIFTWGVNDKGQLGQALPTSTVLTTPTTSPALALEDYSQINSVSAGEDHVILLGADGLIYGWGDNSKSQVAPYYSGSNNSSYLPVLQRLTIQKEVADSSSWTYVETSDDTSYGVTDSNSAYGWGDNEYGEIANTKSTVVKSPERIVFPYETSISSFTAGGNNAVAVSDYSVTYGDVSIATMGEKLPDASTHTDYSQTLKSANGYPGKEHVWTIYGLPEGMSYDSNTGRIFGNSTQIGTFDIDATVTDNVGEENRTFTLTVAKASPSVKVDYTQGNPGTVNAAINVLAPNGTPAEGSAIITYGTSTKTVALSGGKATVALSGTAGEKVNASVKYLGSATLNPSTSPVQSVSFAPKLDATVTATYKSTNPGQITATVNVARGTTKGTGAVTLYYGTAKKTVNLINGAATITVPASAGAKYSVKAYYGGSSTLAAKTTATTSITTMKKRTATVSVSYKSNHPGQVTLTAYVKDGKANGTGSVTLYVGSVKKTASLSSGKAVITIAANAGSRYSIKTAYAGNANLNARTTASTSVTTKQKYSSKPSVGYTVSGTKVTATIKVGAKYGLTPTGTVYLYDGTQKIKTLSLSKGTVKSTVYLRKGTHKLKVVYAGNTYFNKYNSDTASVRTK